MLQAGHSPGLRTPGQHTAQAALVVGGRGQGAHDAAHAAAGGCLLGHASQVGRQRRHALGHAIAGLHSTHKGSPQPTRRDYAVGEGGTSTREAAARLVRTSASSIGVDASLVVHRKLRDMTLSREEPSPPVKYSTSSA